MFCKILQGFVIFFVCKFWRTDQPTDRHTDRQTHIGIKAGQIFRSRLLPNHEIFIEWLNYNVIVIVERLVIVYVTLRNVTMIMVIC